MIERIQIKCTPKPKTHWLLRHATNCEIKLNRKLHHESKEVFCGQGAIIQVFLEFIQKTQGNKPHAKQNFSGTGYLTLNAGWRNWDYLIWIENMEGKRIYDS